MTAPATLGSEALLDHLQTEGDRLCAAATGADLDARVPGLDWTVRDVVAHTAAVHRWAADIVARGLSSNETGGSAAFALDVPDADLVARARECHRELLTVLRGAPDDLAAWTFTRGAPARWFWIRRQAHETAVHRMDVEAAAAGVVAEVPVDVAQDGIHELAAGFARGRAFASSTPGRLVLAASDGPSWVVRFGGERIEAEASDSADAGGDRCPEAVASGTSSALYRWLWNRPAPVAISGDAEVVALWRGVRI